LLTPRRLPKLSPRQLDRFYEWRERLRLIGSDIGNLLLGRYIFRESQRVISKNPKLRGIFTRWLAINYANNAVLGIRRAVDTDLRAVSLVNLLREIIANPEVITRTVVCHPIAAGYLTRKRKRTTVGKLHKIVTNSRLNEFLKFYTTLCAPGSDYLDVQLIRRDVNLIQRKAKSAERFATKRIAHYDKVSPNRMTYSEIDEAFDALDSLMPKYFELFDLGSWTVGAEFEKLFPGWKGIFEVAWKVD
jgi:hypothetical protein